MGWCGLLRFWGWVLLLCYGKKVKRNKRRNNTKPRIHAGYERKNDVMLYCYEKIKRENTVPKSCVIRIALAEDLFASVCPTLNLEKNVTT